MLYDKQTILNNLNITSYYRTQGVDLVPGTNGFSRLTPCPLHNEKTGSFSVNLKTGRFKCFGCGTAGSVFDFFMWRHRCDFKTAAKEIAAIAGVSR